MSDTPRTDKQRMDGAYQTDMGEKITLQSWDYRRDQYGEVVPCEFARQLERELAAITKERDIARDWIRAYLGEIEQIARPQDIIRMKMECGL